MFLSVVMRLFLQSVRFNFFSDFSQSKYLTMCIPTPRGAFAQVILLNMVFNDDKQITMKPSSFSVSLPLDSAVDAVSIGTTPVFGLALILSVLSVFLFLSLSSFLGFSLFYVALFF